MAAKADLFALAVWLVSKWSSCSNDCSLVVSKIRFWPLRIAIHNGQLLPLSDS
jgi:hypothetical protein